MEALLNNGYADSYRDLYPDKHQYTWWSNRGQAYANNVGWRLDYQLISKRLHDCVKSAWVYTDEKFSDHAPHIVDYQIDD